MRKEIPLKAIAKFVLIRIRSKKKVQYSRRIDDTINKTSVRISLIM